MLSLTIETGDHNPNGHTATEVLEALRGKTGSRRFEFRYDLLDEDNAFVQALTNVTACTVDQNWLADIKRTARFTLVETGEINFLADRIKPWVRLYLPPWGEDDWVEWPQGVFLLTSPGRAIDEAGIITRDVGAYDQLQVLVDDKVEDRYTVASGTVYTAAIATLLTGFTTNIAVSTKTLPATLEWEPGTSKLRIINELLGGINYNSLSFDEEGTAVVTPYVAPSGRSEEYTYQDNEDSVMLPDVDQELDLFSIPNKWVLVVSDPDQGEIIGSYTNDDPSSPTSTVNRGRTIVDFRTEQNAADQATLDDKAERLAFEASQIYEAIEFETGLMPIHSGNDVYKIVYSLLAVNAKYSEHTWSMPFVPGATMKHRARRVVTV